MENIWELSIYFGAFHRKSPRLSFQAYPQVLSLVRAAKRGRSPEKQAYSRPKPP